MNKVLKARLDVVEEMIDESIQAPLTLEEARELLQMLADYIEVTDEAVKDDIRRRDDEAVKDATRRQET